MAFEPLKTFGRILILPSMVLMLGAFTEEEAGCANTRASDVLGVSYDALQSINSVEDLRNVLNVATAVVCAERVREMNTKALAECAALSTTSQEAFCLAEAKRLLDKFLPMCLQIAADGGGGGGGDGGDGGGGGGGGGYEEGGGCSSGDCDTECYYYGSCAGGEVACDGGYCEGGSCQCMTIMN